MARHSSALASISESPTCGKSRLPRRTEPLITNRFLLYALTAFLWIFRHFLRCILPVLKADIQRARFFLFGNVDTATKVRRQRVVVRIAAMNDEMRDSTSSAISWAQSASPTNLLSLPAQPRWRKPSLDGTPSAHPCRSVTLKARITKSMESIEAAVFDFMDTIGDVTKQEDIFFDVPYGQMKLRISQSAGKNHGELISYKQTNNTGLNFSESRVTQVSDAPYLRTTLALSLTELGTITKNRRVYERENVRVCLDEVDNLGNFIDIDIKCDGSEKRPAKELLKQMENIRKALQIEESQLVPYSYFELMQQQIEVERRNSEIVTGDGHVAHSNGKSSTASVSNVVSSGVCDDGESGISEGGSCIG